MCENVYFLAQLTPFWSPVVPPQQGAKIEIWPKWSKKVGFAPHRHLLGHKHRLSTRFLSKTAKIGYFPIFSIVFYSKMPLKQRQRYPAPQDKVWIKSIMVFNLPTHRHSNPKRSITRPFVENQCHVWKLVDKTVTFQKITISKLTWFFVVFFLQEINAESPMTGLIS